MRTRVEISTPGSLNPCRPNPPWSIPRGSIRKRRFRRSLSRDGQWGGRHRIDCDRWRAPRAQINIIHSDAEPLFDDEVPVYSDVADMAAHGLEWRPTADEAPIFYRTTTNQALRIITTENAYLIYDMMRDVIRRGTGRRARDLGRPDLAGKTGTSNDRRDAWFSGFNGDIVGTAWVGFDQDRSLGAGEEGSRTALPVWKYFMADALAGTPKALIPRPSGIITARIIPESGLIAPSGYKRSGIRTVP